MSKRKKLGHFHAIVSIAGFFTSSYFCFNCLKPYEKKTSHRCVTHCNVCLSDNCRKSSPRICPDCNRTCRSPSCLQRHQTRTDKGVLPCELKYKCLTCKKTWDQADLKPEDHICGHYTWIAESTLNQNTCVTPMVMFPPKIPKENTYLLKSKHLKRTNYTSVTWVTNLVLAMTVNSVCIPKKRVKNVGSVNTVSNVNAVNTNTLSCLPSVSLRVSYARKTICTQTANASPAVVAVVSVQRSIRRQFSLSKYLWIARKSFQIFIWSRHLVIRQKTTEDTLCFFTIWVTTVRFSYSTYSHSLFVLLSSFTEAAKSRCLLWVTWAWVSLIPSISYPWLCLRFPKLFSLIHWLKDTFRIFFYLPGKSQ